MKGLVDQEKALLLGAFSVIVKLQSSRRFISSSIVMTPTQVPDSCCKSVSAGCGARDHPSNVHYTGCAHQLAALAAAHLLLTAAIAAVICLVHTLGVAIAFKLASSLRTAGD